MKLKSIVISVRIETEKTIYSGSCVIDPDLYYSASIMHPLGGLHLIDIETRGIFQMVYMKAEKEEK